MAFPSLVTPGTQVAFNLQNAQQGLSGDLARVALVGIKRASGTAPANVPVLITSSADADVLFGLGSELAIMARWALLGVADYNADFGGACELIGVPVAAPAGTAQANTYTITGPATGAGDLVIRVGGERIVVTVASGDSATAIASALAAAINGATGRIPFTGSSALGVTTATCTWAGVNGADYRHEVVATPPGISVVVASSATGAGAAVYTTALANLQPEELDFIAIGNHAAADITAALAHVTATWGTSAKKWHRFIIAERGTLPAGEALATAANDKAIEVWVERGSRRAPAAIAAYVAAQLASELQVTRPFQNFEMRSVTADYLPDPADYLLDTEKETFIRRGLSLISNNARHTRATYVRAVTTQTTINGVANDAVIDHTVVAGLVETAREVDLAIRRGFPRSTFDDDTKREVRSTVFNVLKDLEEVSVLDDVDELAAQLVVQDSGDDASIPARTFRVQIPAAVIPPLIQIQAQINLLSNVG